MHQRVLRQLRFVQRSRVLPRLDSSVAGLKWLLLFAPGGDGFSGEGGTYSWGTTEHWIERGYSWAGRVGRKG